MSIDTAASPDTDDGYLQGLSYTCCDRGGYLLKYYSAATCALQPECFLEELICGSTFFTLKSIASELMYRLGRETKVTNDGNTCRCELTDCAE